MYVYVSIYLPKAVQRNVCEAVSHQHPVPLPLMQFALQAGGDELPQLRKEILHHQVGQDL